ncbi:MAG: RNA polymerase sigma factor [Mediterranea sp.]|jgi:RNA polymerase sigma-70 factor (ECF subfamily)|nr:RNA polymerase sigma factor [Mediterranea sp.]
METHEISFRNDILPLKNKLFRLALRITLDRAEAEDVVQETMIRVWNKREEWTKLESIEAYCTAIAKHLALDRSELKSAQTVALTPEVEQLSGASTPYNQLAEKERMLLIRQLIDELPEKQRIVVQLRDIEGNSYREIADALQMTEEQVKVNLFRARQKLRQQFLKIENYGI